MPGSILSGVNASIAFWMYSWARVLPSDMVSVIVIMEMFEWEWPEHAKNLFHFGLQ